MNTEISEWKSRLYKVLHTMSLKQSVLDEMIVTNTTDNIHIDIYDYNSYFKVYNLLPAITHYSQNLEWKYDRKQNHLWMRAEWSDIESVDKLVTVVKVIIDTCEKVQSDFAECFVYVDKILK